MALTDNFITLAWLATFELPDVTLRLCDGGVVKWGADQFETSDPDFGNIGEVEATEESSGDEMPSATLTFHPADAADAATLSQPEFQMSPIRFWLAEVDPTTSFVIGTPDLIADRLLNTTTLRYGRGENGAYRKLDMGLITPGERLFLLNEGNTLSPRHHKSIWPGETGLDNATGVSGQVAWGVPGAPQRGAGGVSGTRGGGGGGTGGTGGFAYVGTGAPFQT